MRDHLIRKWIAIGATEILLSLLLLAAAPRFLNSDKPIFGFLIWLFIPTMIGSSGIYVATRLIDAQKARSLFVAKFPEYSHLGALAFLEFSSSQITENLERLEAVKNDFDFQQLGISPFDLMRGEKKK